jgi:hypothetical protein
VLSKWRCLSRCQYRVSPRWLQVTSGVTSTGVGIKSARIAVTAPATGVGSTATTAFIWPTAFSSAAYTVTLTPVASTGGSVSLAALNQTAAGFTVVATNTTATASSAILAHAIAFHD